MKQRRQIVTVRVCVRKRERKHLIQMMLTYEQRPEGGEEIQNWTSGGCLLKSIEQLFIGCFL